VEAIRDGELIRRESRQDKEFRREAERLIVGYTFDLRNNELTPETVPNPGAGREHAFRAWRLPGGSKEKVAMRPVVKIEDRGDEDDAEA
jgi:hypothetical protein